MMIGAIIILVVIFMPGGVLGLLISRFSSLGAKPGIHEATDS
jgi:hypothetical protein